MHDARPSLFYLCGLVCGLAVLWNLSRTRRVRSRVMRDARPSLFIFAVLSAVLRSGFRDTDGLADKNQHSLWANRRLCRLQAILANRVSIRYVMQTYKK